MALIVAAVHMFFYFMCIVYIFYIEHFYFVPDIGLAVRLFANGPRDLGSIPGRVIPKTQKMLFDASLLNTQHYKVRIKGKIEQSWEGVAPSPTPWCSNYRKGSLRVTLDYGRQLYLLTYQFYCWFHYNQTLLVFILTLNIYIYIYIYIYAHTYLHASINTSNPLSKWLEFSPMRAGFNRRSNHTKDTKNDTWCLLA